MEGAITWTLGLTLVDVSWQGARMLIFASDPLRCHSCTPSVLSLHAVRGADASTHKANARHLNQSLPVGL